MAYSIFYSWQSDSPNTCNRGFIRSAIDGAVKQMGLRVSVEDSPRIESGMEGVAGTPEVASIMFERIKRSAVFIGDMTLVGTIPGGTGGEPKRVPNPNVLLEMGYAAGVMGWGRIICVMNEAFGHREALPFDVRNRRFPINYIRPPDSAQDSSTLANLTGCIKGAIETVEQNVYQAAEDALEALDLSCILLINQYGRTADFPAPNPNAFVLGAANGLDTPAFQGAISRLLDLRLIRLRVDGATPARYAWSYLGKKMLTRFGIHHP